MLRPSSSGFVYDQGEHEDSNEFYFDSNVTANATFSSINELSNSRMFAQNYYHDTMIQNNTNTDTSSTNSTILDNSKHTQVSDKVRNSPDIFSLVNEITKMNTNTNTNTTNEVYHNHAIDYNVSDNRNTLFQLENENQYSYLKSNENHLNEFAFQGNILSDVFHHNNFHYERYGNTSNQLPKQYNPISWPHSPNNQGNRRGYAENMHHGMLDANNIHMTDDKFADYPQQFTGNTSQQYGFDHSNRNGSMNSIPSNFRNQNPHIENSFYYGNFPNTLIGSNIADVSNGNTSFDMYANSRGHQILDNNNSHHQYNQSTHQQQQYSSVGSSHSSKYSQPRGHTNRQQGMKDSNHGVSRNNRESNISNSNSSHGVSQYSSQNSKNEGKLAFQQQTLSQDVDESPHMKHAYKEFYKIFRVKERESLEAARQFANEAFDWMPEKAKWKVYLELAELAKRNNEFEEAKRLYAIVTEKQPTASQGWLEWSKMEEEFGYFDNSLDILLKGLEYCQQFDALLTKAIKQRERRFEYEHARVLLGTLRSESLDKIWRAILEGALFEVRVGKNSVARKLFQFLIQQVSWYGPIYFHAYKLDERDCLNDPQLSSSLSIIQKGLKELPRYGPLWFALLKIMERLDYELELKYWKKGELHFLRNSRYESMKAIQQISHELVWKVYFEMSQVEERIADIISNGFVSISLQEVSIEMVNNIIYQHARIALIKSILVCPTNLKWKIWLAGSRLELSAGNLSKARKLLCLAFANVPIKSKAFVYLEVSRLEEFIGNITSSRNILSIAREEIPCEWKLYLESILIEARASNIYEAIRLTEISLREHIGTGRLWALYMQLCHYFESFQPNRLKYDKNIQYDIHQQQSNQQQHLNHTIPSKFQILELAIANVPKSGEVWCEGARCVLNPMNIDSFDLGIAQRYLQFAILFTPQYGDSFIELLRVEILNQVFIPIILSKLNLPLISFYDDFLSEDIESDTMEIKWNVLELNKKYSKYCSNEDNQLQDINMIYDIESMTIDLISSNDLLDLFDDIILENLLRRCCNADPNYGTYWFHCRYHPYDTSIAIMNQAIVLLKHELLLTSRLYNRAILNYIYKSIHKNTMNKLKGNQMGSYKQEIQEMENRLKSMKLRKTSIVDISQESDEIIFNKHLKFIQNFRIAHGLVISNLGQYPNELLKIRKTMICINSHVFVASEFIGAIMELNRVLYTNDLPYDLRKKLIFGFDQIIS